MDLISNLTQRLRAGHGASSCTKQLSVRCAQTKQQMRKDYLACEHICCAERDTTRLMDGMQSYAEVCTFRLGALLAEEAHNVCALRGFDVSTATSPLHQRDHASDTFHKFA